MGHFEIVKIVIGIADNGHPIGSNGDGWTANLSRIILNGYAGAGAGKVSAVGHPEFLGGIITKGNDR